MMQTAESRQRYNRAARALRNISLFRSLLLQAKVGSVGMIVADIFGHQPFEMPLVEHDDMIKQVSAATTHEALRHAVLPWTSEAGPFWLDAEALDGAGDLVTEVRRAVENQVLGLHVIRKRLPQLLAYPRAGWIDRKNTRLNSSHRCIS